MIDLLLNESIFDFSGDALLLINVFEEGHRVIDQDTEYFIVDFDEFGNWPYFGWILLAGFPRCWFRGWQRDGVLL